MAIQFYTLEEAARLLNVSTDELRMMSRRGELRHFQDRGTLRFRAPDVEELARRRGLRSDPEVSLGEGPKSGTSKPSTPGPRRKSQLKAEEEDDRVDLGSHRPSDTPSGKGRASKSGHVAPASGSDSDVRLVPDGSEVSFKVASDSDVKIVEDAPASGKSGTRKPAKPPDSGVRLILEDPSDSDVKIVPDSKDEVNLGQAKAKTKSDSDIRLEKVAEPPRSRKGKKEPEGQLTGEFDLDAELEDSDEQKKLRSGRRSSPVIPTESPLEHAEKPQKKPSKGKDGKKSSSSGGSSDFELTPAGESIDALNLPSDIGLADDDGAPTKPPPAAAPRKKSGLGGATSKKAAKAPEKDSSDEFVLSVEDSELDRSKPSASESSDEFELSLDDNPSGESALDGPSDSAGGQTGSSDEDSSSEFELSLDASPSEEDSTEASSSELELSLEGSPMDDSSSEFELSLEDAGSPQEEAASGGTSSGEFELSLDDSSNVPVEEGTSEFDLALDDSGSPMQATEGPSDSEFDLTMESAPDELEDALAASGGLADLEDSDEKPLAAQDEFETDFDVPSIEEESDSQAVAVEDRGDTDLEQTSDFGVALSDDDIPSEDASGSQVVALEEEDEADDEAATVDRRRRRAAPTEEEDEEEGGLDDFEPIDLDESEEGLAEEEGEELPQRRRAAVAAAAPVKARWGPLPAILLIPSVILLFFVGIMTWETLNLMWGNHQGQKVSGVIVPWVANNFNLIQSDSGGGQGSK